MTGAASLAIDMLALEDFHLWQRKQAGRPLRSVELELTARCNNNCTHCYINLPAGDTAAQEKECSTETILALMDRAADLGALWCLLTGGEPLLRDDFEEIYSGIRQRGFLVSIFTNATLVTAAHIRLFRAFPPRRIEVTVYGCTKSTYEQVTRQPGSFKAFERGLQRLLSADLPVSLKTVATRANRHEQALIRAYCDQRSHFPFRFDPLLHLRLDGDPERNRDIIAQRLSPKEVADLEASDPRRMDALRRQWHNPGKSKESSPTAPQLFQCRAGLEDCTIGWDGTFRLCSSLTHPDFTYNLRTGGLEEAWLRFAPACRQIRPKRDAENACAQCGLVSLCLGCPAHLYLETGRMDGDCPYFCNVATARAHLAQMQHKRL